MILGVTLKNDTPHIAEVVTKTRQYLDEVIVVDGGSKDNTEMLYELRKHRVILTEVPISCKWDGHYSSLSITKDGFKTLNLLTKKLVSDLKTM